MPKNERRIGKYGHENGGNVMKIYKGYEKYSEAYALPHIIFNHIKCRYYAWIGMAGNIDIIKIDGIYRKFDIKTHKPIKE